jgi:hypothetical protein
VATYRRTYRPVTDRRAWLVREVEANELEVTQNGYVLWTHRLAMPAGRSTTARSKLRHTRDTRHSPVGVPPRFRTADPIGSDPEWRMSNAGTA